MRWWRFFIITVLSFLAVTGGYLVKNSISLGLCILLTGNSTACYININDGRVNAAISKTDHSTTKTAVINNTNPPNQNLPTHQDIRILPASQKIAIPPIIRPPETNLYLQNALPQDFRISSQIPYSSGKQEILLSSPSTGAEQLYTFNVPGASNFQLFEVEYRKVSAIDFSSLTNTGSLIVQPEQIKSTLNKFKISFTNNSLSKITLADGTTADISADKAVIKSPKGQTVETLEISQNELIDQNTFVTQELNKFSKNQDIINNNNHYLLANSSELACQASVSSSLNRISDSIGLLGNTLTKSKSPITKAIGWAISFSSGAIKSNISNKNPMLQEVNCRPPVQCEEQRVSGGSEIRTDLFQVAQGANKKVNLTFEFFEIPDRLELYFDGKQIFAVGPQSGSSTQTFTLPDQAKYVGVKLIGNNDINTRWWYVISCKIVCDKPQISQKIPQRFAENKPQIEQEWIFIRNTLKQYYEETVKEKSPSVGYAHQMYNLVELSYPSRKEVGGWAGDFTRTNLLFAAKDIKQRISFWKSPPYKNIGFFVTPFCLTTNLVGLAINDCGAARAGEYHFEQHLVPAFKQYIKSSLLSIVEQDCPQNLREKIISKIKEISQEHETLLSKAVKPGFDMVSEMSNYARNQAKKEVSSRAKELRINTVNTVIQELLQEGKVKNEDVTGVSKSAQ